MFHIYNLTKTFFQHYCFAHMLIFGWIIWASNVDAQCYNLDNEIILFNVNHTNQDTNYATLYVLTDYKKNIIDTSSIAQFEARPKGKYCIFGIQHLSFDTLHQVNFGQSVYGIFSACFSISDPLEILVCPSEQSFCHTDNGIYGFMAAQGNSQLNTVYVLTDTLHTILAISDSTTFVGIDTGLFIIHAINYDTLYGLAIGNDFHNISGQCYDISYPLIIKSCEYDLKLALRVYLEGALVNNGNNYSPDGRPLMRDDLRVSPFDGQRYIPNDNPYNNSIGPVDLAAKYNHKGIGIEDKIQTISQPLAVFGVSGQDAIVDWIFVELRSKDNDQSIIASRPALLQRDGDIVEVDGTNLPSFGNLPIDSAYIVVRHRNHLGIMTHKSRLNQLIDMTLVQTPLFDYGTSYSPIYDYTGLATKNSIVAGYRALWAGDFDGNRKVKIENPDDDSNILFFDVFTYPSNTAFNANFNLALGYFQGDYDLNSKAKYDNPNDDNNFLNGQVLFYPLNNVLISNFNHLIEQVKPGL